MTLEDQIGVAKAAAEQAFVAIDVAIGKLPISDHDKNALFVFAVEKLAEKLDAAIPWRD